jgi:hypothetical protein
MFHKITTITSLPDLRLLAHFSDGQAKEYDLKPLLERFDAFRVLCDVPGLCEQVQVDPGGYGISWNDDLDLSSDEIFEHGRPATTPFDRLISFADATELWGLSESTLRKAVAYRKLIDGVDVKKFGKQWLVTRDAMEREYGPLPA